MQLPHTFAKNKKHIHAIVETPKGCASNYNFDQEAEMFKLKKILPEGLSFLFTLVLSHLQKQKMETRLTY